MFKTNRISYYTCYSTPEIASLIGRSERTIQKMIHNGLKTIDAKHPSLVRGLDLKEFLKAQNDKNRHPTDFMEMYCMKCRECRIPLHKEVWFSKTDSNIPRIYGICSECKCIMCKTYKINDYPKLKQVFHFVNKPGISDSTHSCQNNQFGTDINVLENEIAKKEQICIKF